MLADQTGPAPALAPSRPPAHCPGCWSPAAPGTPFCPACGFWLAGPQAPELHWIESELQRVDAARTWLISRRALLLGELTAGRPGPPGAGPVTSAPRPVTADETRPRAARPEISGQNAARLLLAAGAALVVIAATIFTIAGWSRLGETGRAGILTAITAAMLAAASAARRRGLGATAETVAGIGLALTLADGYLALRVTGLPWASGGLFAAASASWLAAVLLAVAALARYELAPGPVPWPVRGWIGATMLAAAAVGLGWPGSRRKPAEPTGIAGIAGMAGRIGMAGMAGPVRVVSGVLIAGGCAVPLTGVLPAGWAPGVFGGCGWAVSVAALTTQHVARRRTARSAGSAPAATAGQLQRQRRALRYRQARRRLGTGGCGTGGYLSAGQERQPR